MTKYCLECKKFASYNMEGEQPKYCNTHKTDIMINVVNKRCFENGCNSISPVFNVEGQTKGLYCGTHKHNGMIDVISKRCNKDGCNSISPVFNVEGQTKGLYCGTHKHNGMVDVMNKRCNKDGCNSISPKFNVEGQKKGIYCGTHKLTGMVDVLNKRCKTHLCYTQIRNNKYKGYCLRCFMHTFPNEPVSRNYKTKEQSVVDNVKIKFPDISWVCDKTVSGGCSKKRPDLFADMGTHVLMGEVDENQHTNYDCSCDNRRTMELSQDVGHRPIVFIRFNPDSYIDVNGNKITSCWGLGGNGIMTVKKCKIVEWAERINALNNQIQYWIDNTPDKMIETVQLYYS